MARFPRQVSGYALEHLALEHRFDLARALVGSEGTCAVILSATLRLVTIPAARRLVVPGFTDACAAADAQPGLLALEGLDQTLTGVVTRATIRATIETLPPANTWLSAELGTTADGDEAWPGREDAAVPPDRLGSYLRGFTALLDQHGLSGPVYGHFGEGCLHVRIDFDFTTREGTEQFRALPTDAAKLKAAWDPGNKLNSGMILHPLDAGLRVSPARKSLPLATVLLFHAAGGDFAKATRPCVGVGKSRSGSPRDGAMCPSYRATGDERDSTRGRARTLYEMAQGEAVTGGWRSTEVRDALGLCLSCKGCSSD
ncbi:hypothetical protein GCM10022222_64110 [Amycolatopsis ultiminotia]|uniref:FAD-binding oxidoreductase/transferase type 4 C-terminal domain-containing protein n=1 Tax=Amycolatopsis ultiminotia TaxID=543629 RepID=A0ABP6XT03_9PSEU